jgi:DNA-binding CsgD family transcriptional regulator
VAITPRQLDSIRAHVETGIMKAAAARLGVSTNTLRGHLAGARIRLGVDTTEQAVYVLTVRGELVVPGRSCPGRWSCRRRWMIDAAKGRRHDRWPGAVQIHPITSRT